MPLNFASPQVMNVTWLNPTERFEINLRHEIGRIARSWSSSYSKKSVKPAAKTRRAKLA